MENGIDLMHWEPFFDFDDEKVDWFFIALENVNGIIAFTDENFILFWREKFCVFSVTDSLAAELKWRVQEWNKLRENVSDDFWAYFDCFEDLLYFLSTLNLKGLQTRILETSVKTFSNILFLGLFF
jgi:hypothetical protein